MLPDWITQPCPAVSAIHRDAAAARQGQLTKPTGALGRLETLTIELAGLQHTEKPRADRARRLRLSAGGDDRDDGEFRRGRRGDLGAGARARLQA
jgi:Phosphoribosyltransferase